MDIDELRAKLSATRSVKTTGRVLAASGVSLRFVLPSVRVGDVVLVERPGGKLACEVVGFVQGEAVAMPLGLLQGVGPDDPVENTHQPFVVRVGDGLLGRVVSGLGIPIDGGAALEGAWVSVDRAPPSVLERKSVARVFATGIRAIDAFATLAEGQRVGLFAGSGVGKTTLLGALARNLSADITVIALVGERGREVGDFVRDVLDEETRERSVIVAATSDATAIERIRAAQLATTYAEYFRDQGRRVLLLVDSLTRFARAQREIGLATGEPPTRRGYPPSTFAILPRLLERAGPGLTGSITGVYTVLVEGSDMDEPIADEVRGLVDGHIVLDREVAARGRYPAVDVTRSVSRLMDRIVPEEHRTAARALRSRVSLYEAKRDLLAMGAYVKGHDRDLDRAIESYPAIERFLQQVDGALTSFDVTSLAVTQMV